MANSARANDHARKSTAGSSPTSKRTWGKPTHDQWALQIDSKIPPNHNGKRGFALAKPHGESAGDGGKQANNKREEANTQLKLLVELNQSGHKQKLNCRRILPGRPVCQ
jgi:hypothetical protein